jgi:hypothetical protein
MKSRIPAMVSTPQKPTTLRLIWQFAMHMLMSYEGWQFKLTLADKSEEL